MAQNRREHSSSLIPANSLLRAVFDNRGNVVGYEPIVTDPSRHYVLMPDRRSGTAQERSTFRAADSRRREELNRLCAMRMGGVYFDPSRENN